MPRLHADLAAIEQVLANLIDNAIEYRSPDRALEVTIRASAAGGGVEIAVADNGRGIAPSDRGRVFGLFRRAGPDVAPGEGVVLAFVEALVRAMGGTVALESTLGRGSVFTVALPGGATGG